jgi:cellulose synthase/poly-beta-1,6-N-acetylglucosamine synthase-like glycosyltransferase
MFTENLKLWTTFHFAALFGLLLYGFHRLWLLLLWHIERKNPVSAAPHLQSDRALPTVTVQLPLFNERFVAMRILDAAAKLDWPMEKLEIQVLDDSADDTRQIVDERAVYWNERGITIKVLHRLQRKGYKAGALQYGLNQSKGEFIAIFDADFVPPPDFLRRTVPYFSDRRVGMVQARWGFLNREYSWLTGIQSLLLGQHFTIEHLVRFKRGFFFNFNGTAGIWRRKAIESAGGWQSDTVTEDLDLSYRAELAGWRFVYLDDFAVPSELPVTLSSFRGQQQRWAKGSVQTAKKILPRLLSSQLPVGIKFEAMAHLLSNFCWLLGSIVTLTLYSTISLRVAIGPYQMLRLDLPLFMGTSFILFLYFLVYALRQKRDGSLIQLLMLPVLTIGIAPSIALSVIKGLISRGGVFRRTPKFGLRGKERLPGLAFLYRQQAVPYILMNTALFVYSLLPLFFVCQRGTWLAIPFILLFPGGFLLVIFKDLLELKKIRLQR